MAKEIKARLILNHEQLANWRKRPAFIQKTVNYYQSMMFQKNFLIGDGVTPASELLPIIQHPDWIENNQDKLSFIKNKPTKLNQFENDSGFYNKDTLPNATDLGVVSFLVRQNLSDEQKACVRENIGAGDSGFSGDYNDLTNKPIIPIVPTKISAFENDKGYLTSYTETDPTVPAWAKAATKPSYTANEVGAISITNKGMANGVAELDENGKVPATQLPDIAVADQFVIEHGLGTDSVKQKITNDSNVNFSNGEGTAALGKESLAGVSISEISDLSTVSVRVLWNPSGGDEIKTEDDISYTIYKDGLIIIDDGIFNPFFISRFQNECPS